MNLYRIKVVCYLPIIGSCNYNTVLEVKLHVVDRSGGALGEVGVAEHRFHSQELLTIGVEQFVFGLA